MIRPESCYYAPGVPLKRKPSKVAFTASVNDAVAPLTAASKNSRAKLAEQLENNIPPEIPISIKNLVARFFIYRIFCHVNTAAPPLRRGRGRSRT